MDDVFGVFGVAIDLFRLVRRMIQGSPALHLPIACWFRGRLAICRRFCNLALGVIVRRSTGYLAVAGLCHDDVQCSVDSITEI